MASSNSKQYGLIINKKFNINEVKRATVFNNETDSDDDAAEAGTSDWIKRSFQKQAAAQSGGVRRQTEIDMKRALDQDPTVYKYDEIYEDLEKKKAEETKKKSQSMKPRYIQNLLKVAQQRKLENERRIERQVQKEREAEGEQYKDKETFVTSAYKKKLEEFQKFDEEERKKDMLEEICDVSKQQDLSGFYRHLYKATVDTDASDKKEPETKSDTVEEKGKILVEQKKNRQYRKRKASESSSLEEGEHNSDSDTTIESSSSSNSSKSSKSKTSKKMKIKRENKKFPTMATEMESDEAEEVSNEAKKENSDVDENKVKEELNTEDKSDDIEIPVKEEKQKINIWIKRTVGPVLEAALERYYKRKAERLSGQ